MKEILKKINKIQLSLEKIIKNAENPYYNSKYADLNNIKDHIDTQLAENNLMVFSSITNNSLKTTIYDIDNDLSLSSEISLTQTEPQKKGAEITYYRRYNIIALFDLKIEDDDANITTKPPKDYNSDKPKIDIWLTEKQFKQVLLLDKAKIGLYLKKYDGKTIQSDDNKIYGMKKDYRKELEEQLKK